MIKPKAIIESNRRYVLIPGAEDDGLLDSATLNLDFTGGQLDSRIDFQRTTVGTYYRGQFNQNLVTQSETFSGWFLDGITAANSSEQNPTNAGTAYGITETATTGNHRFGRTGLTVQPSSYVTTSAYLKAGLRTLVGIGNNQLANTTVTFQLTGSGSFGAIPANALSASITPVGNGWYRCSVTHLSATNGTFSAFLNVYTGTLSSPTASYAGNASALAIYAWGVQVTEGSLLTPYIPTTTATITQGQIASSQPWNLVTQSETFSTWTALAMTVANSAMPSPTGVGTAYGITEDGTTNQRALVINLTTGLTASQPATATTYVKAGARNRVRFVQNAASGFAEFLLTGSGSVLSNSGIAASIDAVGNGWYRCRITANCAASGTLYSHYINPQDASGNNSYVGDGQIGIYVWGAQVNTGSSALDYRSTTSSALWLPRFENDPVTGEARGLLIEGGATNIVTQSESLSTWATGGTTTVTAAGTSPGGNTAVLLSNTTTNSAHSVFFNFGGGTTTTYTISAFIKKNTVRYVVLGNWVSNPANQFGVCVDLDNPTQANLVTGATGAGTSVAGATITPVGNGWYRVTVTGVMNSGSQFAQFLHRQTAYTSGDLGEVYVGATSESTYIWGFQCEAQSFASSYIPTTTASVAKGADSAVMTGTNFSSWYNQSEGTVLCEGVSNPSPTLEDFLSIDDGATTNSLRFLRGNAAVNAAGTDAAFLLRRSGTAEIPWLSASTLGAFASGTIGRYCVGLVANDGAGVFNNGTLRTDNAFSMPTVNRMTLHGFLAASHNIRRIAYWPTRLPNATLQSLTT